MSHQASIPPLARRYFRADTRNGNVREHPLVSEVFVEDIGWRRVPGRKRVSLNWLRSQRARGVTHVTLDYLDRRADFSISELVRSY